jgi:hypothetical protein
LSLLFSEHQHSKVKVKFLWLSPTPLSIVPWIHIGAVEVWFHTLRTSAKDGCEWSASRPDHFTPRIRTDGNQWTGGWVCPTANLEAVEMTKKFHHRPCPELKPGYPTRSLVTVLTELPQLLEKNNYYTL